MARKSRDVERSLQRKGFATREGGRHKRFTYYTSAGQVTAAATQTSRGHDEISDAILSQMAKQVRLTKPQFLDLVDCPMTREEFERLLLIVDGASK